jgi:peptide/nickel transport system substrate-binding protein
MDELELRELITQVKTGRLSRRGFVQMMVGLGLTAPLAAQMLASAGVAQAQSKLVYKPTKRGGGGALKTLWWQGATLLNPYFAVGTKDQDGSRIFYEPLAGWDPDGNLSAVLAAEIPTVQNGGLAKDGKSVVWKIKKGVQWHDGKPLTADDVVFNWEYAADPATAAYSIATYKDIKVEKIDSHTVRVVFPKPTPYWADAFVGVRGMILPKHVFEPFKGGKSREAPANLKPVGTGPYRFVDFKPGDMVKGELNPSYHMPNRPYFDTIEMKGGGDAASAARAVLQTGEFDYAWNLQVEDEILKRLEQGGKGTVDIVAGGDIEHIQCNFTDPWKDVDGERSSLKTQHPFLSDPAVRQALNLLVDRGSVQEQIYGRTGFATANFLNAPERFRSPRMEFNGQGERSDAAAVAGATSARSGEAQRTDPINPAAKPSIVQIATKAERQIKSVTASVLPVRRGQWDTYTHFYTDIQMYTTTMTQPDPEQFSSYVGGNGTTRAGRNITAA